MKDKTKRRLLAGASGQRSLEMNWELPNDASNHPNDWIGLFKGKPTNRESTSKSMIFSVKIIYTIFLTKSICPSHLYAIFMFCTGLLQRINPAEHPSGYYKTQYKIRPTPNFEKRHDRCVQGFWIAHLRNNT